jgi:hypothetical protein
MSFVNIGQMLFELGGTSKEQAANRVASPLSWVIDTSQRTPASWKTVLSLFKIVSG